MTRMSRVLAGGAVVLALVGLAGCSGEVSAEDAYAVGCPAVDAVAQGGTAAGQASLRGLEALHSSNLLGDEAQTWLGDAITFLESGDADALPAEVRERITSGCADHGQPLTEFAG